MSMEVHVPRKQYWIIFVLLFVLKLAASSEMPCRCLCSSRPKQTLAIIDRRPARHSLDAPILEAELTDLEALLHLSGVISQLPSPAWTKTTQSPTQGQTLTEVSPTRLTDADLLLGSLEEVSAADLT